jgi:hypothetical protein
MYVTSVHSVHNEHSASDSAAWDVVSYDDNADDEDDG